MEFSWPMVGAIVTLTSIVGLFALLWLRWQLGREFTPHTAHDALAKRMDAVEHSLRVAPTHQDISNLSARVGAVERGVAVVQQGVDGIREGVHRVEKMTDMLVKHQLEKEA